jgi:hypothetical protein
LTLIVLHRRRTVFDLLEWHDDTAQVHDRLIKRCYVVTFLRRHYETSSSSLASIVDRFSTTPK